MITRFILIRHGQTEWNREERFRGRVDIPLNDTGKAQATRVAAHLAGEQIDAIYSSPLQRALQTATPLADAKQLQVQIEPGLNDISFGALEGLNLDEARRSFPEVVDKWLNEPGHCKFPKGDSVKSLHERLETTLDALADQHPGQSVVLVSHRVVCHAMVCMTLGLNMDALWRIRQDNACINRFERHDIRYVLTLMNDTDHLR